MNRVIAFVRDNWPFVLLIAFGLYWHALYFSKGITTFGYDEQWQALAALRVFDGDFFSAYPPGQKYYSSIEIFYLSPLLTFIDPQNIFAFRAPRLLWIAAFFFLFAYFIRLAWNRKTALLALAMLVMPVVASFKRWMDYSATLPIAMAILVMLMRPVPAFSWKYILHFLLLGFSLGFGLWASPEFFMYALLVPAIFLLESPEWSVLHEKLSQQCKKRSLHPTWTMCSICVVMFGILGSGLQFAELKSYKHITLNIVLILLGCLLCGIYLVSKRRKQIFVAQTACILGVCIGDGPRIASRYFLNIRPDNHVIFRWQNFPDRVHDLLTSVLPRAVGYFEGITPAALGIPLLSFAIACVASFLLMHRHTFCKVITLQPLKRTERRAFILATILILPLLGSVLRGGGQEPGYIQIVRVATITTIAVTVMQLSRKLRTLGISLAVLFAVTMSAFCTHAYLSKVHEKEVSLSQEHVQAIESFFVAHNTKAAYAPYDIAHGLTFLTSQKVRFDMLLLRLRFSADREYVKSKKRFGILYRMHEDVPHAESIAEITQQLEQRKIKKFVRARIANSRLRNSNSIDRWHMHVLEDI